MIRPPSPQRRHETCPNCSSPTTEGSHRCASCAWRFPMGYWAAAHRPTERRFDALAGIDHQAAELSRRRLWRFSVLAVLSAVSVWGLATLNSVPPHQQAEACRATCERGWLATDDHHHATRGEHMSGCMSDCLKNVSEPIQVARKDAPPPLRADDGEAYNPR